jgi:uracil-DNA glycosylase
MFLLGWALLIAAGIGAILAGMWPQAIIALGAFAASFLVTIVKVAQNVRFAKRNAKPS